MVGQWERGAHAPRIQYHPAIIEFLGHDGWLVDRTLADRIYKWRARKGWSQARLGQQIGVSERTIGRWERGIEPTAPMRDRVERMLAGLSEAHALVAKAGRSARR
ncbi:helix-turn-helix domain-containing protein [Maricaulis maris]|uniref:helix-turn-helix domain-containing protein n=1 Tax=Maricaulis maris TaxID=74318 RepID=UPI003B8E88D5